MAINIDHYQDSGPLLAGRGTTTTLINNVGFKVHGGAEGLDYAEYPIIIPDVQPFARSFHYFTFFKLSGTYVKGARTRILLTPVGGVKMFARLTDTYSTPSATHVGDLTYVQNALYMFPRVSTTSPITGLTYPRYLAANTTYYTEYLEMQLYVPAGLSYASLTGKVKLIVDEYEEDDVL